MLILNSKSGDTKLGFSHEGEIIGSEDKIPFFNEKKDRKGIVRWGEDNLLPEHLIELYYSSPYHSAIINSKSNYISGSGFEVDDKKLEKEEKEKLWRLVEKPNSKHNLNQIVRKATLDLELFGGYALVITANKLQDNIAKIEYIDISKLRYDVENNKVVFHPEWHKAKKKEEDKKYYDLFDGKLEGKKIFIHQLSNKGSQYYPRPAYESAIKAIATDAEVTNYNYSSIVNGFSGGKLITFLNGEPDIEQQRLMYDQLKEHMTTGNRANNFAINFADGPDSAVQVDDISETEIYDRFVQLNENVQQKIMTSHSVTSPMLFGIKTEGQLGGRNEVVEAYEMFKNTYIIQRQTFIEEGFNYILNLIGLKNRLQLIETEPIKSDYFALTPEIVRENLNRQEIRQMIEERFDIDLQNEETDFEDPNDKQEEVEENQKEQEGNMKDNPRFKEENE